MSKTNPPAAPLAKFPLFLFVATSLVHLLGALTHQTILQNITKPFLLLLLTVHFVFSVNLHFHRLNTAITIGLMFSFLGDTLLIFADAKPFFFLMGLLSFLCTHICYLFAFLSYPNARQGSIVQHPLKIIPFVVFLVAYGALLFPNLVNYLKIPVLVYSTVIIAMAISTLNLQNLITPNAFRNLFAGALLFVISDSILAFQKFQAHIQIPFVEFWIMLTYILGQYLIVLGVKKMVLS